jgi:dephospho-CoA kinase
LGRDTVVVITGPIESGKTYVVELFSRHQWRVLDADVVGHRVLREANVIEEISKRWPHATLDGEVNRRALAEIVFANPRELRALEQMTHPRIQDLITDWLAATDGPKVIEVSVLAAVAPAWGMTVVIDAPLTVRKERLQTRGMEPASVRRRMASQPPRREWLRAAQIVLENGHPGPAASLHLIDFLDRRR